MDIHTVEESEKYFVTFAAKSGIPGHAMVALRKEDPGGRITFHEVHGFYPIIPASHGSKTVRFMKDLFNVTKSVIAGVPGTVLDDAADFEAAQQKLDIRIDSTGFESANRVIQKWSKRMEYQLLGNDCVSLMSEVGLAVGLQMPDRLLDLPDGYLSRVIDRSWPPKQLDVGRGMPIITMPFPSPEWVKAGESLFTLPAESQTRAPLLDLYAARDIIMSASPLPSNPPDRLSALLVRLYLNSLNNHPLSEFPVRTALQNLRILSEKAKLKADEAPRIQIHNEQKVREAGAKALQAQQKERAEKAERLYLEARREKEEEARRRREKEEEDARQKRLEEEKKLKEKAEAEKQKALQDLNDHIKNNQPITQPKSNVPDDPVSVWFTGNRLL